MQAGTFQCDSDEPVVNLFDFNVFVHLAYPKKPILFQAALNVPKVYILEQKNETENVFSPKIWS